MTVNTQELRELYSKSTQGEWRQVDGLPYLYAFTPGQIAANHCGVPCVGRFDYGTGNLEFIAAAHNNMPVLLDEIDALRAELQARQWQPIETAPHETLVILGWYESGVFKQEIALASAGERHSNGCSNRWWHGRATHWMPLPSDPPQGETT